MTCLRCKKSKYIILFQQSFSKIITNNSFPACVSKMSLNWRFYWPKAFLSVNIKPWTIQKMAKEYSITEIKNYFLNVQERHFIEAPFTLNNSNFLHKSMLKSSFYWNTIADSSRYNRKIIKRDTWPPY